MCKITKSMSISITISITMSITIAIVRVCSDSSTFFHRLYPVKFALIQ